MAISRILFRPSIFAEVKVDFLKHTDGASRLILIFTGWSTGPELFSNVDLPRWDVAVAYQFDGTGFDNSLLYRYTTVYLFAWSLGVFAADTLLEPDRITAAFAINGSVNPVSDTNGIPESVFIGTADNLSPRNLSKFRRRMMPDAESFKRMFPDQEDDAKVGRLAEELYRIHKTAHGLARSPHLRWTRAYIGMNDRIFPPENLLKSWNDTETVKYDDSHFMDIPAIIRSVITDTGKVASHFSKAAATYDSAAIAQEMIALKLASMVRDNCGDNVLNVLEIGPGTGLLTNIYSRFIQAERTDFVDITPVGPFNVTGQAHYHQADAELWVRNCNTRYDLIISSSVIQWFADIPAFIRSCSELLNPGGILAIATFAPGNLEELDALRPAPLLYPSLDTLHAAIGPSMEPLRLEQASIKLEFSSRRQLILHLKRTGVAGSQSHAPANNIFTDTTLNTLTYRPIYLIARRKC